MFRPAERKLFQRLTPILTIAAAMLCVASSPLSLRNALQAQDLSAQSINTFAKTDSLFLTVFDPKVSPGKGTGWKPFNRMRWFLGQRASENGDVPFGPRMQAWEEKQSSRDREPNLDETWTSIGPANYAGRIISLAWHPTNTNIIYAGSASGGLWKTTNSGTSWTPLTDDLPSLAVGTVALDPSDPNIVYIGTGEGSWNVDAVYGAGIFKSTDGGATWSATGMSWQQSQYRTVNQIIVHPSNPQILWAATNLQGSGGVFKSTNGGSSWTRYLSGEAKDLDIDPSNANTLYASLGYPWGDSGNGVYKSTDGGLTWALSSTGLPSGSTMGRMRLSITQNSPQTLYLGVAKTLSAGAGLLGIYKSTNGGASWTQQATTPNMYGGQGWYNIVCEAHPTNSSIVYSSGIDLYKSTDSGVNWTQKSYWYYSSSHSQYVHADHHALAFKPGDPNTIIEATDGGLFRSTNGGDTWTDINSGLTTFQYYGMCDDALQPNVTFGGTQDNGTNKYNNSTSHVKGLGGDGGYCNVDFTNSSIVYATTQNGNHYKSTGGGAYGTFYSIQNGISGSGAWVTPRVMDPTNSSVLYTGTKKVYRTTNGGSSWTAISSDLSTQYISTLAVAPSNPAVIYAGCESNGQVWKTTNTGGSWTLVNSGLPYRYITRVAVDPTDANIAYVTVSGYGTGHAWKTTNGGSSWSNISSGLPDIPCNAIVVDSHTPSNLYAGTDLGVYASTNGGASWSNYSSGLPNVVIDDLALHPTSGMLRAATHGRGMWETPTSTPTVTVISPNGGEQWIAGIAQNITWGTGGVGGNVSIEINRSYPGGSWEMINVSTANDGSYSWTVTGPTTSAARVRITSLSQPALSDISNNDFAITLPQLTLSSPNGGETWIAGTSQTVSWTLSGTTGNVVVQINRSYPSGSWESVTTSSGSSYSWNVTTPTSSAARMRVYLQSSPSIGDTSNANFTIVQPTITLLSPNGGESLTPGSQHAIRWNKQNTSSAVKVEINRTYPSGTWEQIAAAVSVDSVMWTVDAGATTAARARVTLNSYPTATDVSDANFTILTPSLAVTTPNGGEALSAGTTATIRWTRTNLAGALNVFVNRAYPSGTWEPIAVSVTADTFAWAVNTPYSNSARVRVSSAMLPTYSDESNANFTIGTALVLTAPDGGENWSVGLPQTISWARYNASGNVTVQLNRSYPGGTWETLSTTESGNSLSWTVTAPATTSARMRAFVTANPSLGDTSNSTFTIPTAGLAVTSPVGGELWTTGSSQTISWTRNNASGNVSVLLNRDYPNGPWETLTMTVGGNSYAWSVNGSSTTNARVKIQLTASPQISDLCDGDFSIGTPALTLLAPNGGETWLNGATQPIRWSREFAPGGVTVQINRLYPGGTWTTIATSVTGDSLVWTVNSAPSATHRVKIFLTANSAVNATSASNFTVVTPQIAVTAPNGGESWIVGASQTITFTRTNADGPVTIALNRAYPSGTWETLTTTETGTSFAWTATEPASSACRVRVTLNAVPTAGDSSNANFSLIGSSLTLTSPDGGENLIVGGGATITWNRMSADGAVTLQLNRDYPGGTWETLADTLSGNSYAWNVTEPGAAAARMRVTWNANPTVQDASNANFTITQPALSLSAPDGGEMITLGGPLTIRWNRTAAPGDVTVLLNRNYPGGAWETLTTAASADSFAWTASGAAASACRVKIHLTSDTTIGDFSAANFSLVSRLLTLTSHQGGDTAYTGSVSAVEFTRTNAPGNATVQINRDYPAGNWETLSASVSGSSYNWSVSGTPSAHARLRIFLSSESYVGDTSSADFAIVAPSLVLLSPAEPALWPIGSAQQISWQRYGVSADVRVEINRNYPNGGWTTLAPSVAGSSFQWTVTSPATQNARVRIVSTSSSAVGDTCAGNLSIVTRAITLLTPHAGDTARIGFPHTIRWIRTAAPGEARVELNLNWPSGAWELLSLTAADSVVWTPSLIASSAARVRVALDSDPAVADTSDGNFAIILPTLTITSPVGGERWMTGSQHAITWTRTELPGTVRVEFNPNFPGGAWTTLATGIGGNSYNWTITQTPTGNARIRVISEEQPMFTDASGNFAVTDPALALTWPGGTETFVIGRDYTLTFSRGDHPEPLTLQLNRDYPGGVWETIAAGLTGNSVLWTASAPSTFAARLRLVSDAYPGVGDTSATQWILPSGITLLSPHGGEVLPLSTPTTLRWVRVEAGNVDVLLNRAYPSGSWETLAADFDADSLVWIVGGASSSACRIKVRETENPNHSDQSAANFEIQQPTLTLTLPAAGDTFAIGVTNTIRWTRNASASGAVRIELKRDYPGGSWVLLGTTESNQWNWIATGPEASSARIRILSEMHAGVGDTLDAPLAIVNASWNVTDPTESEAVAGDPVTIRWSRNNVGPGANVYLCRNYPGGTWVQVASNVQSDEWTWTVTPPRTGSACFRVTSTRIPALGDSSITFAILEPTLTLASPNGGTLGSGNVERVTWTKTDFDAPVTLDVNVNYPNGEWQTIASGISGNGYDWTVSQTLTSKARIRVRCLDPELSDVSDGDISIVTPTLAVLQPNGGQLYAPGNPITIQWSRAAVPGGVDVALNRDFPDGAWEPIANDVTGNVTLWTVNGDFAHGRIRVSMSARPEIFDISDTDFGTRLPSLYVVQPNAGDTLILGDPYTVRWGRVSTPGLVKVELNRSYPEGAWEVLSAATNLDSLSWTVSGAATTRARVRVTLISNPAISDISDADVRIAPRSVTLLAPLAGDSIAIGRTVEFRWNTIGLGSSVNLYVKRTWPAGTWELVQLGASGGSYHWTVTGSASETARFRALSATNPSIGDTTDGAVRIGVPQLLFSAPIAAETFIVGQSATLRWTRHFAAGDVRVELSRAGVAGPWEEIGISNADSLSWIVSSPASDFVRLRLSLTDAPFVNHTAAFDCRIVQPALQVVAPIEGQTLAIGRTTRIEWMRTAIDEPIDVWLRRAAESEEELFAENLTGNSFDWNATGPASTAARIILRTASSIEAESGGFALSQPVISFAAPLGGETFMEGDILPVRWHRVAVDDPVSVEINRDFPAGEWTEIAHSVGDTFFDWTVSGPTTYAARLRLVSTVESALGDTLGENMTLLVPALEWDFGERSEALIGFPVELHWLRTAVNGAVTIRLSRDGGSTWPDMIAEQIPDDFFEWIPAGDETMTARLRVESAGNPAVHAVTEEFALLLPQIEMMQPVGGETFAISAPLTIRWNRVNHPAAVNVLIRRDAQPWETLAIEYDGDSLVWIATGPASSAVQVRVVSAMNDAWFAESEEFSIQQAALSITEPLPETELVVGEMLEVQWNRVAYSDAVRVMLRRAGAETDTLSAGTFGSIIESAVNSPVAEECWIVIEDAISGAPRDSVHLLGPYQPSVALLSPEPGAQWITGQSVTLRWQRDHADGDAVVSVNENYPGGSWQMIGTTALDSMDYVPLTPSDNLAVAAAIPARGVADTVTGVRVVQPALTLQPLAQSAYRIGETMNVHWLSHHVDGLVRLELNRNFPSDVWEVLFEGADTSFAWTAGGDTTSAARLRVRSLEYAFAADTLGENVRIYQPGLSLVIESDGDTLYAGHEVTLTLAMTDEIAPANIALQREPGGEWETLFAGVASGAHAWMVTPPEASAARFRAFVPGDAVLDDTTSAFTILQPSVSFQNEFASDYSLGDTLSLAWDAWGVDAPFRLLLVRDEASAETLSAEIHGTSFDWIVTPPRTSTARLIVQDATGAIGDSSAPFAIHVPELLFVLPSESGTDTAGNILPLEWQWVDGEGAVRLDVSRDGLGGAWTTLADSLAETSYDYLVVGPETDSLRFRVRSLANEAIFAISPARQVVVPDLTMNTPGGETWYIGEQRWIHWSRAHYTGPVIVEATAADRAEPWEMLANEVMTDSFLWTVTGPEADLVALRVTATLDPTLTDSTDTPLSIARPRLEIVSPNGGDTLTVGEEIRLLWNSEGVQGNIAIGLWRGTPVNRFDTLFVDSENDGEEFWTISAPAAQECFLILVSLHDTTVWDTSDARFVILEPSAARDLLSGLPADYGLNAPYPNPFNGAANLEFALPRAGEVKIVVYDVMGREAATLVNDVREAGRHRVSWKADNAASGMYFARMTSGDFTAVRKLQLIK